MPHRPTYPILYDEMRTISISDLKKWNYLKKGSTKTGVIQWKYAVNNTQSIMVFVDRNEKLMRLSYTLGKTKDVEVVVMFDSVPSNLGKGEVLYFICPYSGKRCRKLYSYKGYFVQREVIPNGCYSVQAYSKEEQETHRMLIAFRDADRALAEINSKHFKKYYNGKPTRRYLRLLKIIEKEIDLRSERFIWHHNLP